MIYQGESKTEVHCNFLYVQTHPTRSVPIGLHLQGVFDKMRNVIAAGDVVDTVGNTVSYAFFSMTAPLKNMDNMKDLKFLRHNNRGLLLHLIFRQ